MTFSSQVKDELCRIRNEGSLFELCELYGILLFSKSFKKENISVFTENQQVARFIEELIIKNFGFILDIIVSDRRIKKHNFLIKIVCSKDREFILNKFGHNAKDLNLTINKKYITEPIDLRSVFLRGVFLSCGTISNPNKDYHIEFCVQYMNLAKCLIELIESIVELRVTPCLVNRRGKFIVYIKGSESITDFLTYIGATSSAMDVIQIKMIKEVRNYVNRTTNFETANLKKTTSAAATQIQAINLLKKSGAFNSLDEDLKELAELRLHNPDMSLKTLGENLSYPLSRSGVNHKLKKIISYANYKEG